MKTVILLMLSQKLISKPAKNKFASTSPFEQP